MPLVNCRLRRSLENIKDMRSIDERNGKETAVATDISSETFSIALHRMFAIRQTVPNERKMCLQALEAEMIFSACPIR